MTEGFRYFLSLSKSLSRPAKNISKITPISAKIEIISVCNTRPKRAGPKTTPVNNSPITAGIPIL